MSWTREDQNASQRRWYRRNRKKKVAWQQRRRYEMKEWLVSLKLCCIACGEPHPGCLAFHHRDGSTKEADIASAVHAGWSRERIEAEIAKCDVLCFNCHARLHWEERRARKAAS